jgi:hypothetical protein
VNVLGVGAPAVMVINRCPVEQGQALLLIGLRHQLGEVLLCAGNCMGLLLIVILIPAS